MKRASIRNPLANPEYLSELIFLEEGLLNNIFSVKTIQSLVSIYAVDLKGAHRILRQHPRPDPLLLQREDPDPAVPQVDHPGAGGARATSLGPNERSRATDDAQHSEGTAEQENGLQLENIRPQ